MPVIHLPTKLLTWAFFVLTVAFVMLVMSAIISPAGSGEDLVLMALLSTMFGVPLLLLAFLGLSAFCSILILTMDKRFSFARVFWLTSMALALSILNTTLSFYLISELGVNSILVIFLSVGISIGLVLAYGYALGKLAGVARKPRLVVTALCVTYTVVSSSVGLFLG